MRPYGFAVAAIASAVLGAPASADAAQQLLPHRAVYDLSLAQATDESGINAINGRMVYEFAGSKCDGYTVRFRYVTRIETDDATRVTDLQTTTYEDADGKSFRFDTKSFIDQTLDKEVKGRAQTSPDGTKVTIEKPEEKTLELPPTQFPTAHLLELLGHARNGQHFYQTTLFDGAEDADKVMLTTVIVGDAKPLAENDPERTALNTLAKDDFWPVSIAYFGDADGGEEMPDYSISFKLHESGITRDLTMDYGTFAIRGRLVNLALFKPDGACHAK
jgi:hypothetical protein